jgi:uncharacterized delta-60 repeat protein
MSGRGRADQIWRVTLLLACLAAASMAVVAPAAAKRSAAAKTVAAGRLDKSFGKGGKAAVAFPAENAGNVGIKYELPFEFTPGHLEMAQTPGGGIVVAGATKIVRFRANGKPDPGFGSGGSIAVPRPPGSVFVLAGVAVDSYGRTVLAGLARPLPTNSLPDPVLSQAVLMRFNADGSADASFGSGGTLVTDFGLGAPKTPGGPYPGASVGIRDVVIDSQNRPVLTGGYVDELLDCSRAVNSKGFVARLTEAGALDGTFGEGGIRTLSTIVSLGELAQRAGGYLTLSTSGPLCKGSEGPDNLIGFDENGNLDSSFASFGFRTLHAREAPTLTVAPSGKILLLGRPEQRRIYKKVKEVVDGKKVTTRVRVSVRVQTVQRLLANGAADPSFSRIGQTSYLDPAIGSLSAIAVDKQERIYLAGRVGQRVSKSPRNTLVRTTFLLERTTASGSYDHSFGKKGMVATGFGGPTSSFATQVMLDTKGRALVGGGITSPRMDTGGGYAIARYLTK